MNRLKYQVDRSEMILREKWKFKGNVINSFTIQRLITPRLYTLLGGDARGIT